jgi:hypothetical protein
VDIVKYPNAGALFLAGLVRTALAGCKIRLFKDGEGIIVGPALTLAQLEAAEADFTGYAEIVVANMLAPGLNPLGGASITTGTQQFATAAPYTITNMVGGGWLETATGDLLLAWSYGEAKGMIGAGDVIPVEQILLYG